MCCEIICFFTMSHSIKIQNLHDVMSLANIFVYWVLYNNIFVKAALYIYI